jgi:hypothetical protein
MDWPVIERIRDLHRDISLTRSANQLCPSSGSRGRSHPADRPQKRESEIGGRRVKDQIRPGTAGKNDRCKPTPPEQHFLLKLVSGGRNDKKNTVRSIIGDIEAILITEFSF